MSDDVINIFGIFPELQSMTLDKNLIFQSTSNDKADALVSCSFSGDLFHVDAAAVVHFKHISLDSCERFFNVENDASLTIEGSSMTQSAPGQGCVLANSAAVAITATEFLSCQNQLDSGDRKSTRLNSNP